MKKIFVLTMVMVLILCQYVCANEDVSKIRNHLKSKYKRPKLDFTYSIPYAGTMYRMDFGKGYTVIHYRVISDFSLDEDEEQKHNIYRYVNFVTVEDDGRIERHVVRGDKVYCPAEKIGGQKEENEAKIVLKKMLTAIKNAENIN